MVSVYGANAEQQVPDSTWLEQAGKEGWVVLTKDKMIRWRVDELAAVQGHGVRVFYLGAPGLTGDQIRDRLLKNMDRVLKRSATAGPWICAIRSTQVVQTWPKDEPKKR